MIEGLAIRIAGALLLASLLVFGGCRWQARMDAGKIAAAKAETKDLLSQHQAAALAASEAARKAEQDRATAVNDAAAAYERGKHDAQDLADRTAADLRAGNVRLRREIAALAARGVPDSPAAAGQPADAAARGAALVGAAVGVGRECDARVSALIQAYDSARR